jgi:2-polyprenyl-6-methoxyphenol hydroxylase-like FAD-dependent oxidoreductase
MSMENMVSPNVAVIGAGPAGLVFAISMARRGIPTIVYESMDDPTNLERFNPSRSYAIDITGHGLRAIRHIDGAEDFNRALIPFKGLKLNDRTVDEWSEPGWIGSRGDIVCTLLHIARRDYTGLIDIRFNCRVKNVDVSLGTLEVQCDTAHEINCGPFALLVAADGGGSEIREQAAKQDAAFQLTRADAGYYLKMLAMDRNVDRLDQRYLQLLSKGRMVVAGAINGPGGTDDPRWLCAVPYAHNKLHASMEAAKQELLTHIPALQHYCSDESFATFASSSARNIGRITRSSQLYAGRVVFLGDAAISYPPVGQGVNGAMESAVILDQALAAHIRENNWGADQVRCAMAAYNARWLPETRAVSWFGEKVNQAKRWHVIRLILTSLLRLPGIQNLKSSAMSYTEAQRRARWLGPLWLG